MGPAQPIAATEDERAIACLKGLAVGDAIGKQSEGLSQARLLEWYPDSIRGFEGAPGSIIRRYVGNRKREWLVGETTDDTERTLAVARAILTDGGVHHTTVGRELLTCEKCVHPGLLSLWEFHQAADAARIATRHDGCGAAIRVAAVGILYRSHRLDDLVRAAREASIPTHGGRLAIAAAAATAAAISAAIEGADSDGIFELAVRAATLAERGESSSSDAQFANAVQTVHRRLIDVRERSAREVADRVFPDTPLTIVPLALALATLMDSADAAILLAANIGGDSDSVGSIAGSILGARYPGSVSEVWWAIVEQVNGLDVATLARQLRRLRH